MILNDLADKINFYIEHGHANDEVVITLSENSIAGRAYTKIYGIYPGFDWEQGQMRIEPEINLLSAKKDRDTEQFPHAKIFKCGNRKRTIIKCPICESQVKKGDKYCNGCGQRLSEKIKYKKMY